MKTPDTLGQWAEICVALVAYCGALAGFARLLGRISPSPGTPGEGRGEGQRRSHSESGPHPNPLPAYQERGQSGQSVATVVPILIGLAWLTWPVWLSPHFDHFSSRFINDLVEVQPWLVANGVLTDEPPWPERTIAYHLTRLNQDMPMHLPTNAIACIAFHGAIGLVLLSISGFKRNKTFLATKK